MGVSDAVATAIPFIMLFGSGFALLVGTGWLLTRLRGEDGPLTLLDQHTARDHLRSRWF